MFSHHFKYFILNPADIVPCAAEAWLLTYCAMMSGYFLMIHISDTTTRCLILARQFLKVGGELIDVGGGGARFRLRGDQIGAKLGLRRGRKWVKVGGWVRDRGRDKWLEQGWGLEQARVQNTRRKHMRPRAGNNIERDCSHDY